MTDREARAAASVPPGERFGIPKVSQVVGLGTLIKGYLGAVERFRLANTHGATADDTFIPLFEALNWAASADELLDFPQEPHLRALRFARNRVHHQQASAPFFVPGTELGVWILGVSALGVPSQWHWRQVEELPEAPPKFSDPKGEKAYRELLAGKPVGAALAWLERYLNNALQPNPS